MSLLVHNDTDTSQVTTSCDHGNITGLKFDIICDFPAFDVDLDCVVHLDEGVRVADGPAVMGDTKWNPFGSNLNPSHFTQLVLKMKSKIKKQL